MDQRVGDELRVEARFAPPPGFHLTLSCLMLALFLGALNQTIVAAALPTIGKALGDVGNLSWVISAYFLFGTAVAPILGKLSDIYGRRLLLLWSIGLFVAGSIVCALAPNMLGLIIGRALQGVGGGGLFPMVHSTLNDLVPPRERARYFVFNSIVWTSASLLGPVLGGVLAEYLHWSMIFWLNVPLGIGAMLLLARQLHSLPKPGADRRFDVPGGLLLMASAVVFLLFVTWGGVRYAWTSLEITLLGAATLLLVSIYVVRAHRIEEPFLPLTVLRGSVVPYGIIGGAFALGSNTGLVAFLPLYFQIAHKFSAAEAGLALVPFVISFVPGALIASFAMKRADYKWFPVAGLVLTAVVLALLAFVGGHLSFLWFTVLLCVAGFGCGPTFPISTIAIQNAVAQREVGVVTSASHYFRLLVSALAVALGGTVMLAGLGFSPFAPGADRLIFEVSPQRMGEVFSGIFVLMAAFAAIGAVGMGLMEGLPMRARREPVSD